MSIWVMPLTKLFLNLMRRFYYEVNDCQMKNNSCHYHWYKYIKISIVNGNMFLAEDKLYGYCSYLDSMVLLFLFSNSFVSRKCRFYALVCFHTCVKCKPFQSRHCTSNEHKLVDFGIIYKCTWYYDRVKCLDLN